jgi:hypothetical protein
MSDNDRKTDRITYLTDAEKSPGEFSLLRIKKAPSECKNPPNLSFLSKISSD